MRRVKCITINTDASFNGEYKVGGYAFYIRTDNFRLDKSGVLKQVGNAEQAEIMAIGNALHTLIHASDLPKAEWLVINTDCLNGLNKILNEEYNVEPAKKVRGLYKALIAKIGSTNNHIRHVKAHNGLHDTRSWANDWCDKEAKKAMRQAVFDKTGKKPKIKKFQKLIVDNLSEKD